MKTSNVPSSQKCRGGDSVFARARDSKNPIVFQQNAIDHCVGSVVTGETASWLRTLDE